MLQKGTKKHIGNNESQEYKIYNSTIAQYMVYFPRRDLSLNFSSSYRLQQSGKSIRIKSNTEIRQVKPFTQ